MPEDLEGQPFPDGEEPEEEHHGAADEEFATVVLDEDFVRSAEVHEPSAEERMLAAAQSHAETEVPRPYVDGYVYGPAGEGDLPGGYDPDAGGTTRGYGFSYESRRGGVWPHDEDFADEDRADAHDDPDEDPYDLPAGPRAYRGHVRWHRPVAWVLAVVMGVGVVALAFAAVYRGAAGQREEPAPTPSTGVGVPAEGGGPVPGANAGGEGARPSG